MPPIILLHQVQMAENIGAVARAMGNFALPQLRLIAPLHSPTHEKAIAMSAGAESILEQAIIYNTLQEATADLHWLYGTCATVRHIIKPYTPINRVASHIINKSHHGKVGILFGPERTGLDNDCLARCHEVIQIPTNPDFSSLNIAQACVIIGYELFKNQTSPEAIFHYGETCPAPQAQLDHFLSYLEESLDETHYWRVPSKKDLMWRNLKNIFTRFHATEQDIQTLRGVIKSLKNSDHNAKKSIKNK